MKNKKKYLAPKIEATILPDDIIAESRTFGESADDTVVWPSN